MEYNISPKLAHFHRIATERLDDWMALHVPADTGTLEESMRRHLKVSEPDAIIIGSDVEYHGHVEKLGIGTNWTKPGSVPQFTQGALDYLLDNAQAWMAEVED